jgi:hypothetical protein
MLGMENDSSKMLYPSPNPSVPIKVLDGTTVAAVPPKALDPIDQSTLVIESPGRAQMSKVAPVMVEDCVSVNESDTEYV